MNVALIRFRIAEGMHDEVAKWMRTLRDHHAACVETLDRERMGVEAIFREDTPEGSYLSWFVLHGDGEHVDTSEHEIDRVHVEFMSRCIVPGSRETRSPELLLLHPVVAQAARSLGIEQPAYG